MRNLILILFAVISSVVLSQENQGPLAAYQKNDKWIIIDHKGNEIFSSPNIFEVLGYSENAYRVRLKDKDGKFNWAFLDDKGEILFAPITAVVFDIHDGLARSARKNAWSKDLQIFGYFDRTGKEVIKHEYDDAIDFSEGLAFVMNSERSGYIDTKGNLVIKLDSMAGNEFSQGLAAVNTADFKVGYFDKKGKTVVKFKYDEGHPFSEGRAAVYHKGKFGYINKSGAEIILPLYDFANKFSGNHAFVAMARDYITYTPDWGFIDSTGKLISGFKYQQVEAFSEGLAAVKWGDKWGFIDFSDSVVIPNKFERATAFVNGLAYVFDKENNKYGFIDKKGNWVIDLPEPEKLIDLRLNKKLK